MRKATQRTRRRAGPRSRERSPSTNWRASAAWPLRARIGTSARQVSRCHGSTSSARREERRREVRPSRPRLGPRPVEEGADGVELPAARDVEPRELEPEARVEGEHPGRGEVHRGGPVGEPLLEVVLRRHAEAGRAALRVAGPCEQRRELHVQRGVRRVPPERLAVARDRLLHPAARAGAVGGCDDLGMRPGLAREECHGFGAPRRGAARKLPRGRSVVRGRAWYDLARGGGDPHRRRRGERRPARVARARGAAAAQARGPRLRRRRSAAPRRGARGARARRGHLRHGDRRGAAAHPAHPRDPARAPARGRRAAPARGAPRRPAGLQPAARREAQAARDPGHLLRVADDLGVAAEARAEDREGRRPDALHPPVRGAVLRGDRGVGALRRTPARGAPAAWAAGAVPRGARPPGVPHHHRARPREPPERAPPHLPGDARRGGADPRRPPRRAVRRPDRADARARAARPLPRGPPDHRREARRGPDGGGRRRERRGAREERDLDPRDGPDAAPDGRRVPPVVAVVPRGAPPRADCPLRAGEHPGGEGSRPGAAPGGGEPRAHGRGDSSGCSGTAPPASCSSRGCATFAHPWASQGRRGGWPKRSRARWGETWTGRGAR